MIVAHSVSSGGWGPPGEPETLAYELARRPALCGVNHLRAGTSAGVPKRLVDGPGSFGMIWHLAGPGHASLGPDRDRIR